MSEAPAAPAAAPEAPAIDFSAMDIRVGQFVEAWHHEDSEKLFVERIDLGEDEPRQIVSGLRAYYELPDLEARRCLVVCNLKKAKLAGVESFGMVLCGSASASLSRAWTASRCRQTRSRRRRHGRPSVPTSRSSTASPHSRGGRSSRRRAHARRPASAREPSRRRLNLVPPHARPVLTYMSTSQGRRIPRPLRGLGIRQGAI